MLSRTIFMLRFTSSPVSQEPPMGLSLILNCNYRTVFSYHSDDKDDNANPGDGEDLWCFDGDHQNPPTKKQRRLDQLLSEKMHPRIHRVEVKGKAVQHSASWGGVKESYRAVQDMIQHVVVEIYREPLAAGRQDNAAHAPAQNYRQRNIAAK